MEKCKNTWKKQHSEKRKSVEGEILPELKSHQIGEVQFVAR